MGDKTVLYSDRQQTSSNALLFTTAALMILSLSVSAALAAIPAVTNVGVSDFDMFYSNVSGNNVINVRATIVGLNDTEVIGGGYENSSYAYVDFSNITTSCGVNGNVTMTNLTGPRSNSVFNASCDVSSVAKDENFVAHTITIYAVNATDGGPQINVTPLPGILLYNMTMPQMPPCQRMGPGSTSMASVTNFSDVPYTIVMQAGGTGTDFGCSGGFGLTWSGWLTTMKINWTSLDMSNETIGQTLAGLASPANMQVNISPPNGWGLTRIFMNSTYFDEFDSPATVTFYNLPFKSLPNVTGDNLASAPRYVLKGYNSTFHTIVGDLIFDVGGFTDYNASDLAPPEVTFLSPTNGSSGNVTSINVTVNGTGMPPSLILFFVDQAPVAIYNATNGQNNANCFNTTNGSDDFNCKFNQALTYGVHNLSVTAYDYGGLSPTGPGNTVTSAINFTAADPVSPTVTFMSPANGALLTNNLPVVSFNVTDNFNVSVTTKFKLYENGANRGPLACSGNDTYQSCSYTYSVVEMAEGIVVLNATANDTFDNTNSAAVTVRMDALSPYWSNYSQNATAVAQGGKVRLTINATDDGTNVSSIALIKDNAVLVSNSTYSSNSIWTYDYTVVDAVGSTLVFYYNLTDGSGHVNTTGTMNITVSDLTAPTISLANPLNNSNKTTATFNVIFEVADNAAVNVSSINMTFDGTAQYGNVTACTGSGTNVSCTFSVTAASDGTKTLVLQAKDNSSNAAVASVTNVIVDTTAPVIAAAVQNATSARTTETVAFTINASDATKDVASIKFYVGVELNDTNSAYTDGSNWTKVYTIPTDAGVGSTLQFYFNVTDTVGNSAVTGLLNVTVQDGTAPGITLVSPANGANLTSTAVTVRVNVTDNHAVNLSRINVTVGSTSKYGNSTWCSGSATAYVCAFNFTGSEGANTLLIEAYDNFSNAATPSNTAFTVDTANPYYTDYGPASQTVATGGTATFRVNFTDATSQLIGIDFNINGVYNKSNTTAKNKVWNVTYVVPDTYAGGDVLNFTFNTSDVVGFGNVTPTMTVTVSDSVAPTVTWVSPTNASTIGSSTTLQFNVSDNSAVNVTATTVTVGSLVYVGNTNFTCTASAKMQACSLGLTGLGSTGALSVLVNASDTTGNRAVLGTTFTVDATAPTVTLNAPANNSYVVSTLPLLNFTQVDNSHNASCVVTINSHAYGAQVALNNTVAGKQVDSSAGLANGGTYSWYVTCTDAQGNAGTSGVFGIKVDATQPNSTIALSGATANGAGWYRTPVNVTINGSDSFSGVAQILWSNASGSGYVAAAGTGVQFTLASNLTNGYIYYKANDTAGNLQSPPGQLQFKYDSVAPVVTAVTPSTGLVGANSTISFSVDVTDATSGLGTANYTFGTETGIMTLGTNKFTKSGITTPASDGSYTFYVTVVDAAGNSQANSTAVTVNSTVPSVTADVASGTRIRNASTVLVTFVNIVNGSYALNGATATNVTTSGAVSVPISGPEGTNTLVTYARNDVTTTNLNLTYVVDTVVPAIDYSTPASGATVNGTLTVTVTASDAAGGSIASCALSMNGTGIGTDTAEPYSWAIPTTAYAEGGHTLSVTCTDSVGLTNTTTRSVTIQNTGAAATVITAQGSAASSSAYVDSSQFATTPASGLLYGITGLNTTTVNVTIVASTGVSHSSYLATFIGAVNLTTGTTTGSTVQVLVPDSTMTTLGLTAPFASIGFYTQSAAGTVTGPLTASYVGNVTLSGIVYHQFSVSVPHYSVLFWGVKATSTTTTTTSSTSAGRSWSDDNGGFIVKPKTNVTNATQPAAEGEEEPTVEKETAEGAQEGKTGAGEKQPGAQPATRPAAKTAGTSATAVVLIVLVIAAVLGGAYYWWKNK